MHKYLWVSAMVIVLDQISKTTVEYFMTLGQSIKIIPLFNLTLVYNAGAAFGFLSQQGGWQRWFFLIVAMVITVFLFRWLKSLSAEEKLNAWALSLILGGAIGNIIDRIFYGFVIDFLDFHINNYHWPAFNIADSAIVVGGLLMVIDLIKNSNHKSV